jgi:hypothetical protein
LHIDVSNALLLDKEFLNASSPSIVFFGYSTSKLGDFVSHTVGFTCLLRIVYFGVQCGILGVIIIIVSSFSGALLASACWVKQNSRLPQETSDLPMLLCTGCFIRSQCQKDCRHGSVGVDYLPSRVVTVCVQWCAVTSLACVQTATNGYRNDISYLLSQGYPCTFVVHLLI